MSLGQSLPDLLEDSSNDSYMSVEEDPAEPPLKNEVVAAESVVMLQCVIKGKPVPRGKIFRPKLQYYLNACYVAL